MRRTGFQPWMRAAGWACLAGCLGGCGAEGMDRPAAPTAAREPLPQAATASAAAPLSPPLGKSPVDPLRGGASEPAATGATAAPAKPRRLSFPAPASPTGFEWAAVGSTGGGWTRPVWSTAPTATPVAAEVSPTPPLTGPAMVAPQSPHADAAAGWDTPPWEAHQFAAPTPPAPAPAPPPSRTPPEHAPLAPAEPFAPREVAAVALWSDEAARAVLRRAEAHNRQGVSLALRGAIYSARAEFAAALNELIEARDRSLGGREASAALGRALRALDEIRDLMPRDGQPASSIQLERLSRSHQTPVLRGTDVSRLTPSAAVEAYGTYAEGQFVRACGQEPAASVALHGLGKVHEFLAASSKADAAHAARLAEFYHRAALGVSPANHLAANDLAVLLARGGQYERAQSWLLASVRISPQPTTWRNLAVVHERLGQPELARLARREEQALVRAAALGDPTAGNIVPPYAIELVEPRVFAATARPAYDVPPAGAASAAATAAAPPHSTTPPAAARPADSPRRGFSWGGWFQ